MHQIKVLTVIFFLFVLVYSCIEPYNIHSIKYEKAMVVEGRLTSEYKAHYIKLSYTRPVDEMENVPISNAQVWVQGSDNSKIDFTETSPGLYQSDKFAGIPGISYQLFFITSDGNKYQSNIQELIASPPIDSIYQEYVEKPVKNTNKIYKGIQFFIDTHSDSDKTKYFKYEWEETYEVRSQFPSEFEFFSNPDTAIYREKPVHICYASGRSSAIEVGTTINLTENRLIKMPVRYLTDESDHLRYAYSILVKQFVISGEAYSFYREIVKNNTENGSLFDKQLGAVVGNIQNVEDPFETVLGFFEVSGVSEKRIFVKITDLDKRFPWPKPNNPCSSDMLIIHEDFVPSDTLRLYVIGLGYNIVTASYCVGSSWCPYYLYFEVAPKYCTDCRSRGPIEKPDFWIY